MFGAIHMCWCPGVFFPEHSSCSVLIGCWVCIRYLWLTRVVKKFVVHRRTMYWHPITYDPVQYERTRGQETRTLVFCKCSVKYELFLHHDGEDKFRNHEPTYICGVSTLVQHLQKSGIHPRYQIWVPWCPLMSSDVPCDISWWNALRTGFSA